MEIFLNTTPPVLSVTAPSSVRAPESVYVQVSGNEPLYLVEVSFVDSMGDTQSVGVQQMADDSFAARLHTVGLPSGEGMLVVRAVDVTGNPTQVSLPTQVIRPRVFEANLNVNAAFRVRMSRQKAWNAHLTLERI